MEIIKKNQIEILELKRIITEMKNSLRGLNSSFQKPEGKITELENRLIEDRDYLV